MACQDSMDAGQNNDKYFMGAFEDGDFIIVGLDPDAAQSRFSTLSPSGFPEHHKRCLSSCVCVCAYDTLLEYVQVLIFSI